MRILVIGSGGREHALLHAMHGHELTVAPGNAGMSGLATVRSVDVASPDEIVALLEREVRKAIDPPEFKERFAKQDIWIVGSSAAEAAARIKAGSALWADVVVRSGMKGE